MVLRLHYSRAGQQYTYFVDASTTFSIGNSLNDGYFKAHILYWLIKNPPESISKWNAFLKAGLLIIVSLI